MLGDQVVVGCHEELEVADFRYWKVYLHKQQGHLGRMCALAKTKGVRDISRAGVGEHQELKEVVIPMARNVVEKLFDADCCDYAEENSKIQHLHRHIIPRYSSPREAFGTVFEDLSWGRSYSHCRESEFPQELLFEIRDAIKEGFKR